MKVIGLARIGKDAELRKAGQESVLNLALAFSYGKKGEDGRKPTQWVDGTLWGKRAEVLHSYLVKGQLVVVQLSEVHIETFEGKNGAGSKLVGRIDDIEFAGSAPGGSQDGQRQQAPRQEAQRAPAPRTEPQRPAAAAAFDDFDVPF